MTRLALPLFCFLAALGAIMWGLIEGAGGHGRVVPAVSERPLLEPAPSRSPILAVSSRARARDEARRARSLLPRRRTAAPRRGGLDVQVVGGGGGGPLEETGTFVSVRCEREALRPRARSVLDEHTGTWRFRDLPVGRAEVHVRGAQLVARTVPVEIGADRVVTLRVVVEEGGAIAFRVERDDDAALAGVRLTVLDAESGVLQRVRGGRHLSKGLIEALKPGAYLVRAEDPTGRGDERTVHVRCGETTRVALRPGRP